MSSMPQNGAKKSSRRCDGAKTMNMNQIMARELNAFHRESQKPLSSDSGESSGCNSVCNDLDYENSGKDIQAVRIGHQNSRDEIAEKLSQLKIGGNKNLKSDSGTVDDITSEDNLKSDSIIAGKSPVDVYHNSVQSLPDDRCSLVLAGRLDSKDYSSAYPDEQSLLNIAINESVETDSTDCRNNADLSHFEDSLEVRRGGISTSSIYGRGSLEVENYCCWNKPINEKRGDFSFDNNENVDPNSLESNQEGRPRIISDEMVKFPINWVKQTTKISVRPNIKECATTNVSNSSDSSAMNRFRSSMNETERLIIADVKTPNPKNNVFIEDCVKSTPKVEVYADTFGSDLITDIANLSTLGESNIDLDRRNVGTDDLRDKIFERFSQLFTEAPTKFTEKLLTIVEQSVWGDSRPENPNISGVSLDRLTEEFRKMCRDKRIEDESMPSQLLDVSNFPNLEGTYNAVKEAAASSPFHNFTKFGRGKKVYPRTPRSIFNSNNSPTKCNTPNCANALHRLKNNNLYSPKIVSPGREANSTATFEFWENLCFEMSPTKQSNPKLLNVEESDVLSLEDLIRKSNQQMAALNQSIAIVAEVNHEGDSDINIKKSTAYSRECQSHCNSIKQKLTENTGDIKQGQTYDEIEQILSARLVEKRRKCFEEASKAFETKENANENGNRESVDKVSGNSNKNESLKERDNKTRFMSTLALCADYFDHFKTLQNHRASLQCIMECSEHSESTRKSENYSRPTKCVNTLTIDIRNRVQEPEEPEENLIPENKNLVARACLYISGTPETSKRRSAQGHCRLSPIRRLSPGAQPSSVISKKIKSPVSSARRRSIRVVRPTNGSGPQSPSIAPEDYVSNKQNRLMKSASRCPSSNKLKSTQNNSPSLMDVTNTKKRFEVPKFTFTTPSPSGESPKISCRLKKASENTDYYCQNELEFNKTRTPELEKRNKYFYTPGKSPLYSKVKPRKKFFETPRGCKPLQNKILTPSPGSYRINYNTVQSPVGMYIRGTDPNLIKNVKGKTNDRMLTPRAKSPKSKCQSPILARSPRLSPISAETARLKFQLTPSKKQMKMQSKESDVLNIALCESDPSSENGSESTTPHSPFPKIFYNPAPCVKMVNDNQPQRNPRVLASGVEEKIIYRHDGRLKSAKESKVQNFPVEDKSTKDSFSHDLGDISLLRQRPTMKSNYLLRK